MRSNESIVCILPMTSLNGGLVSPVQREQVAPALFSKYASIMISPPGFFVNVFFNSQCLKPQAVAGKPTGE